MINYIEKGLGLHRAITDAGHKLYQQDKTWVSDDDTAVQGIIDAFDPDSSDGQNERDEAIGELVKMEQEVSARFVDNVTVRPEVYNLKADEASSWTALSDKAAAIIDTDLMESDYELIYDESDKTVTGVDAIAASVLAKKAGFAVASKALEKYRRRFKLRIENETYLNIPAILAEAEATFDLIRP